jgi:hypothetical protein
MARGSSTSNRALVQGAERALDQLKYEVARDIGINPPQDGYWGDIPSRQNGAVGGHMVRRMIALAEQSLAQGGAAPTVQTGGTTAARGTTGFGRTPTTTTTTR